MMSTFIQKNKFVRIISTIILIHFEHTFSEDVLHITMIICSDPITKIYVQHLFSHCFYVAE